MKILRVRLLGIHLFTRSTPFEVENEVSKLSRDTEFAKLNRLGGIFRGELITRQANEF